MVERRCGQEGTNPSRVRRLLPAREPIDQPESVQMPNEPLSPELALVDPELGARARAALPDPAPTYRRPRPTPPVPTPEADAAAHEGHRPYPAWARLTAALWLLVLGILIGGAAIPHAQDRPRVVPPGEDAATICKVPTPTPTPPDIGSPLRPGP